MELLTNGEWKRLRAAREIERGRWTVAQGAKACALSERHMRRVVRRIEKLGDRGVLHGNRGRAAANRKTATVRARVLKLRRTKYEGFNDQHFVEKLASAESLVLSRETVRGWLRADGIGSPRKRRPPRHRARRVRKAQAGMMLLWDGSRHAWLEDRGPMLCLVGAIDDATSEFLPGAHFVEQECSAAYLKVLRTIVTELGIPVSAYGDRHSIFVRSDEHWTLAEQLRGKQDATQLGRALEELGVERIDALSPQAKGRIERLWDTTQDRLVSELRLDGATTMEEANRVLEKYRPEHNRRFAVSAADQEPAWRRVPRGMDVERITAFRYFATVANDNTVRIGGKLIDIPPGRTGRSYAKARVEVRQLLDGSWRVYLDNNLLATAPATVLAELGPLRVRKRSAAERAFRKALKAA